MLASPIRLFKHSSSKLYVQTFHPHLSQAQFQDFRVIFQQSWHLSPLQFGTWYYIYKYIVSSYHKGARVIYSWGMIIDMRSNIF